MGAFLALLNKHDIQVLIDVRSNPHSRYVPHFNSPELARSTGGINIQYVFMGKQLGGRPDGEEFYDAEDHVLYGRVAESPLFLKGIERLEEMGKASRVAIMCSEEDPATCHRHLLVGRVLAQRGMNLRHIRGDGRVQTAEDLASSDEVPPYEQLALLEELPMNSDRGTNNPWRSLRPVSRRKQQPYSSER
jgi:uncharacterized protein (DUF488 family)